MFTISIYFKIKHSELFTASKAEINIVVDAVINSTGVRLTKDWRGKEKNND